MAAAASATAHVNGPYQMTINQEDATKVFGCTFYIKTRITLHALDRDKLQILNHENIKKMVQAVAAYLRAQHDLAMVCPEKESEKTESPSTEAAEKGAGSAAMNIQQFQAAMEAAAKNLEAVKTETELDWE